MTIEMDTALFCPTELEKIDFSSVQSKFNPPVNILNPGDGLFLRPLRISDYDNGFLECLKQLTVVGKVTKEQFEDTFNKMKCHDGMYYIIVIEDKVSGQIVGAGTLLLEQKFIHECGSRARIEDIVVDSSMRGKQLGKLLIYTLILLSKHLGCYKVSLECRDSKIGFYESCGFIREEGNANFMQIRF